MASKKRAAEAAEGDAPVVSEAMAEALEAAAEETGFALGIPDAPVDGPPRIKRIVLVRPLMGVGGGGGTRNVFSVGSAGVTALDWACIEGVAGFGVTTTTNKLFVPSTSVLAAEVA
jgi:hypothetical protein